MAGGTFKKNTHRHAAPTTSQPPMNGPSAVVTPDMPAQIPTARPRSASMMPASIKARLPGTQRRRADTLHQPCADQPANGRCKTARQRSGGEDGQRGEKDPAAAIMVAG